MKVSNPNWKERLVAKMPEALAREVDIFETELELRKQGKLDERLIAETRLRRGIYGQRYDNGQRHDGNKVQKIAFPSGELTKGPHTIWDAPGCSVSRFPAAGSTRSSWRPWRTSPRNIPTASRTLRHGRTSSFITSTSTIHQR